MKHSFEEYVLAWTRPVVPLHARAQMYLLPRPPAGLHSQCPRPNRAGEKFPPFIHNVATGQTHRFMSPSSIVRARLQHSGEPQREHNVTSPTLLASSSHFVRRQPLSSFDDCRGGRSRRLWITFTLCYRGVNVLVHVHERLYTSCNHAGGVKVVDLPASGLYRAYQSLVPLTGVTIRGLLWHVWCDFQQPSNQHRIEQYIVVSQLVLLP